MKDEIKDSWIKDKPQDQSEFIKSTPKPAFDKSDFVGSDPKVSSILQKSDSLQQKISIQKDLEKMEELESQSSIKADLSAQDPSSRYKKFMQTHNQGLLIKEVKLEKPSLKSSLTEDTFRKSFAKDRYSRFNISKQIRNSQQKVDRAQSPLRSWKKSDSSSSNRQLRPSSRDLPMKVKIKSNLRSFKDGKTDEFLSVSSQHLPAKMDRQKSSEKIISKIILKKSKQFHQRNLKAGLQRYHHFSQDERLLSQDNFDSLHLSQP